MNVLVTGGAEKKRNPNGTFKQTRTPFSLANFNDGYIDNRGRFRVWMPNHHRAYSEGYVLRSIVAYEFYYGIPVPDNMDIHHKDGNRLNDSKKNLMMITHGQHTSLHNELRRRRSDVAKICKHCSEEFIIKRWRLKDPSRGQYCSQKCFHKHRKGVVV